MEDGATVHTCRLSARMLGALVGVAIDAMGGEFTPGVVLLGRELSWEIHEGYWHGRYC